MKKEKRALNTSDEDDVHEMSEREKRLAQQRIDDVKWLLSTPQGRRFFWDLLGECGIFSTSFSVESLHMAFSEGERNIGLKLFNAMNIADPSAYVTMVSESKGDEDHA